MILRCMLAGDPSVCFDERILAEYRSVLARAKFGFDATQVADLLRFFEEHGEHVLAPPLDLPLPDPSDGMFIEVAIASDTDYLVTGNLKDFPTEYLPGVPVVTPRTLYEALAL